jgi:hypothetical protein
MEWELTFVFEDETRHQLTYVEERVVPEALRSEELHADDGCVLVLSKRTLGAFPIPRPKLRVTIEEVAEASPWTP